MRIQLSTCQALRATRPVRGSYHTHIRAARTEIYAIGREPRRSFIGRSTRADHGNEPGNRTLHPPRETSPQTSHKLLRLSILPRLETSEEEEKLKLGKENSSRLSFFTNSTLI